MGDLFLETLKGVVYPLFLILLSLYPIWLPFFLGGYLLQLWLVYIRRKYIAKEGGLLLEIRLPQEIQKSPLAMEVFLNSLWQKGGMTFIDTYVSGKVRPWFSLEIASIEGAVRFYIWTQPKFKDLIESQLYSQYPGLEVVQVEDYTANVHLTDDISLSGQAYKLDKADAYPIRTYIDYKLEGGQKPEHVIDPIAAIIEWMGSIGRGEQIWLQILIQAHRKVGITDGHLYTKPDWKKGAEEEIKKIREAASTKNKDGTMGFPNPTKMQTEAIGAIERSLHKFPFDVGIRGLYIAKKDADKWSTRSSGFGAAFRPYSAAHTYFNELKVGSGTGVQYPWQDFKGKKVKFLKASFLEAYKRRSLFNVPFKNFPEKPFILTAEEIATIFHLPGSYVTTPTLQRVSSRKSEAPSNIPR